MLLHLGRQGIAAVSERLSEDDGRLSRRGADVCRDVLRRARRAALFLQGCAGDIRPNLPGYPYRCADEADIQWAGRDLGGAVVRRWRPSASRASNWRSAATFYPIRVASEVVELPGKEEPVRAELMAMKIGPFLLLTMPGEPMVEYGFKLEKAIADRAMPIIVGYANGNIGYIATAEAHKVGRL